MVRFHPKHARATTNLTQSKDSSATHIHMHQPRLADLFEEFTRPHTSSASTSSNPQTLHNTSQPAGVTTANPAGAAPAAGVTYGSSALPSTIPSFLPVEDIYVAPQYQPPNPEDEDDVVPDQHAAFGITRAMERRREAVWRDLGLEALVNGYGHGGGGIGGGATGVGGMVSGPAATLRSGAGGAASAGAPAIRVKTAGRRMGGRRVVCLR